MYLQKLNTTTIRFSNTLDLMWNIKNTKNLSSQAEVNLENAYYQCKFGERNKRKVKRKKTAEEEYINYLLTEMLTQTTTSPSGNNVEDVGTLLCMLPWDEGNINLIKKKFMKLTFYGKYNNVRFKIKF